ncbi:MAG: hypothetical protein PETM_01575 [Petrimonas sp.]|jgi:hypothetical protein
MMEPIHILSKKGIQILYGNSIFQRITLASESRSIYIEIKLGINQKIK